MAKAHYKPSDISKANEDTVKAPFIEEHNIMGAKFNAGKISQSKWKNFKKDWFKRYSASMDNVVKNRICVIDPTIEDMSL